MPMGTLVSGKTILNCRYCGGNAKLVSSTKPQVKCDVCSSRGPLAKTTSAAIEGWNAQQRGEVRAKGK